jgi:hypothetical protein
VAAKFFAAGLANTVVYDECFCYGCGAYLAFSGCFYYTFFGFSAGSTFLGYSAGFLLLPPSSSNLKFSKPFT